jgi:hypothetical protein
MPEARGSREPEGWAVRAWGGVGLAGALYLLAAIGIAGAALLYALEGPARTPPPSPRPFPQPQLNLRLDRDPHWSYAPRQSAPRGIDAAMAALAAEGDAGWEPPPEARKR